MFRSIKEQLLNNDGEYLVALLENFGFEKIQRKPTELRFARNLEGGLNISIRLQNNDGILVKDFVHGDKAVDVLAYIVEEKGVTLKEVLQECKRILGLSDDWQPKKQHREIFGGIYSKLCNPNADTELQVLDESILDQYQFICSKRFLDDGISLEVQRKAGIRFSVLDNRIIIPLYDEFGRLVGTKGRLNDTPTEDNPKYLYINKVPSSQLLYSYDFAYSHMYGGDVILAESEKSPLQARSFGVYNVVGLGGSHISTKQIKLIMQCQPKRIIIALDEGMSYEHIKKQADAIYAFCHLREIEIWYWDSTIDIDIPPKASLTDMGKEKFAEIMNEQLIRIY